MRIIYPYNEILPKKSAHDVYVVRNCSALAAAGAEVFLSYGAGSLSPALLKHHYHVSADARLHWQTLPIVRKNMLIPFSYNPVFLWATQWFIRTKRPDWVVLSVLKQGQFHFRRKAAGVKYLYEVHELAWYPGLSLEDPRLRQRVADERRMLSAADAVSVTTGALKDILLNEPYRLTVPVTVVPLAVDFTPLPRPPAAEGNLHLMYVGQMYQGQGVELLLQALARTEGLRLTLVGGKPAELLLLKALAASLCIEPRVTFTGFLPPAQLPAVAATAHVMVAPFSASGRMPFVAHTKLLEYAAWQRPVVAPDLPVVREHFAANGGWVPFCADSVDSLADALMSLQITGRWQQLFKSSQVHCSANWRERSTLYLDFMRSV